MELGEEDVELARERWEAGREKAGLPLEEADADEASGSGDFSVRAISGTPRLRPSGKGKQVDGVNLSESLIRSTKKKYDPFDSPLPGSARRDTAVPKVIIKANGKVKGRIKEGALGQDDADDTVAMAAASTAARAVTSGLLAGYGSDDDSQSG